MDKRKRRDSGLLGGLLWPLIFIAVMLCFASAVDNLDSGRATLERQRLEQTLRQSCAACYAAEGAYPPNLAYLQEHYGVQVDEKRYIVHYDAFAENLMPDIMILENRA